MNETPRWQPDASLDMLQARAQLLSQLRAYFAAADLLEVETPILSRAGNTDPALDSFCTQASNGQDYYLHTSPEYPMKSLLAAYGQSLYQICKVFRQDELGRYHNPEFTLLEWYRVGFSSMQLMDDVEALLRTVLPQLGPAQRLSYSALFVAHVGLDPLKASDGHLVDYAARQGVVVPADAARDWLLQVLFDHVVGDWLKQQGAVFVTDYPASQAALAELHPTDKRLAQRFELYIHGVELANGYQELTNPSEQQARFLADNAKRQTQGRATLPIDQALLGALTAGLPVCAGVALGVDRLLMLQTASTHIEQVLSFTATNA
jgi:lysyl-tRNA synthetase class 2